MEVFDAVADNPDLGPPPPESEDLEITAWRYKGAINIRRYIDGWRITDELQYVKGIRYADSLHDAIEIAKAMYPDAMRLQAIAKEQRAISDRWYSQ